jgi:Transposase DDE domain
MYLAALCPSWDGQLRLLDATPVPCGTSRETVRCSELAGWASYGYCAAHSRWYWGLKLYLLATPDGMPVTWCLADPKLGELEVAAELLDHARDTGALRPGIIVLADKGLAGKQLERYAAEQARVLLAPPTARTRSAASGTWPGLSS